MRSVGIVLIVLLASGCLSGGPSPTPSTPTPEDAQPCAAGPGVFLSTMKGGGFVPPDHVPRIVDVTHDGRLRVLEGHTREGSGRIVEDHPGALADLSVDEVRAMLERRNVTLGTTRDLVVTRGFDGALAGSDFAALCRHVVAAFPSLKAEYPQDPPMCADEGSTTWEITLGNASKTSWMDDCAQDKGAFGPLVDELATLVERTTR
jgi:hypothetical protein